MSIRKPDHPYWCIVPEADDAVVRDRDAIARYHASLDESVLGFYGTPARWRIEPPSLTLLLTSMGRFGIDPQRLAPQDQVQSALVSAQFSLELALRSITEVRDLDGYSGPVDAKWLGENVHETVLIRLGQQVARRSILTLADLGNC